MGPNVIRFGRILPQGGENMGKNEIRGLILISPN